MNLKLNQHKNIKERNLSKSRKAGKIKSFPAISIPEKFIIKIYKNMVIFKGFQNDYLLRSKKSSKNKLNKRMEIVE